MKWYNKVDPIRFSAKLAAVLGIILVIITFILMLPTPFSATEIKEYTSLAHHIINEGIYTATGDDSLITSLDYRTIAISPSKNNTNELNIKTDRGDFKFNFTEKEISGPRISLFFPYFLAIVVSFIIFIISNIIFFIAIDSVILHLRKRNN